MMHKLVTSYPRMELLSEHGNLVTKYAHMDQGSELDNNPKICAHFKEFGYDIDPTAGPIQPIKTVRWEVLIRRFVKPCILF